MTLNITPFQRYMIEMRLSLRMNQSEFATVLGVSRPYISLMETGKRAPSMKILHRLRRKYGFSIDQLLDVLDEDQIPAI